MTRDYKPAPKQKSAGKGNAFITGTLVGLVIGVGLSVGVAVFVTGGESPFVNRETSVPETHAVPQQSHAATSEAGGETGAPEGKDEKPAANRFDFYKILPGTDNQVAEPPAKQKESVPQQPVTPAAEETYYLQVGAFQTEEEADNMKAKLALLGLEAVIQTATVTDKGVVHRVRVGPYADLDQIGKARAELTKNGFNADLVKTQNTVPDQ